MGLVDGVDRIGCALYDPSEDMLKTFVSSTRTGGEFRGYEFKLSRSDALSKLAAEGGVRLIDDIPVIREAGYAAFRVFA